METLTDKKVKIRKSHYCWGCAKKFNKGDFMQYIVNIDGGEFNSAYWCMDCIKFMDTLDEWETEDLRYGELSEYDEYKELIEHFA